MKSLLLINVLLSLLIASYHPLFSGNIQFPASNLADGLIHNMVATSVGSEKVQLQWELDAQGRDLILFVQKSTDGVNFFTFGSLRGSSSKSYAFFDHLPEKNVNVHYRVKVVGLKAGKADKLSDVISHTHTWDSQLHSTQTETAWTVNLPKQMGEKASLQVMNSMGQMVVQRELSNLYSKSLRISTEGLIRGTYLIQLVSGDNRWITRLLKN